MGCSSSIQQIHLLSDDSINLDKFHRDLLLSLALVIHQSQFSPHSRFHQNSNTSMATIDFNQEFHIINTKNKNSLDDNDFITLNYSSVDRSSDISNTTINVNKRKLTGNAEDRYPIKLIHGCSDEFSNMDCNNSNFFIGNHDKSNIMKEVLLPSPPSLQDHHPRNYFDVDSMNISPIYNSIVESDCSSTISEQSTPLSNHNQQITCQVNNITNNNDNDNPIFNIEPCIIHRISSTSNKNNNTNTHVDPRMKLLRSPGCIHQVTDFTINPYQLSLQKQCEFEKDQSVRISADILFLQSSYLRKQLKSTTIKQEDFQLWHKEVCPLAGKYSRKPNK